MAGETLSSRTPLARARGLGSAKSGLGHWWAQRWTALALIPLVIWVVIMFAAHAGDGYGATRAWLGRPEAGVPMILLVAAILHHAQLGLQVVIEDYVKGDALRLCSLIVVKGIAILLGLTAAMAVLAIVFGATL